MEQTSNVFNKGLLMDTHPMVQGNDTLSDALNATFVTMNGNEIILLNDMGNRKIDNAYLPSGYLPVGMKEYGGIIYVAAYNPITNLSLIGSFPSPERRVGEEVDDLGGELYLNIVENSSNELGSFTYTEKDGIKFLDNDTVMVPLTYDVSLRTGDKFTVYSDYIWSQKSNISNYDNIDTESGKIYSPKNKLYTLLLGVLNSQNNFVDITESLLRWETKEIINEESEETIYKSEIVDFENNVSDLVKFNTGYFIAKNFNIPTTEESDAAKLISERQKLAVNTYAYKLVGPLYLKATLNHLSSFNYTITGSKTENDITLYVNATITYNCPDGIEQVIDTESSKIYTSLEEGYSNYNWFDFYIKNSDEYIMAELLEVKKYINKIESSETNEEYEERIINLLKLTQFIQLEGESDENYNLRLENIYNRVNTTQEENLIVDNYKEKFPQILLSESEEEYNERVNNVLLYIFQYPINNIQNILLRIQQVFDTEKPYNLNRNYCKYNELTNTYTVQVRKQYIIHLNDTDIIEYYICPTIYNQDTNELHLSEYSLKGIIDTNLFESGEVLLNTWKFTNDNNSYKLYYNFNTYAKLGHSFLNLCFHFLDITKQNGINKNTKPEEELSNLQNNDWISINVEGFNGNINLENSLEENVLYRVLITYEDNDGENTPIKKCINFWELYLTNSLLNNYNFNDFRLIRNVKINPTINFNIEEGTNVRTEGELIGKYYSQEKPDDYYHMYKDVRDTIRIDSTEELSTQELPTWLSVDFSLSDKKININNVENNFEYNNHNYSSELSSVLTTKDNNNIFLDYKYDFYIKPSDEKINVNVDHMFISLEDYLKDENNNQIKSSIISSTLVLIDSNGDRMAIEYGTSIRDDNDNYVKPRTNTSGEKEWFDDDDTTKFHLIKKGWERFTSKLSETKTNDNTSPRFVLGCTHDKNNLFYYRQGNVSIPDNGLNPYPVFCWINCDFSGNNDEWALFDVLSGNNSTLGLPLSTITSTLYQSLYKYKYFYTFNSSGGSISIYFKDTSKYSYLESYTINITYNISATVNYTLKNDIDSDLYSDLISFELPNTNTNIYSNDRTIIILNEENFEFPSNCSEIISTLTIDTWCQKFEDLKDRIENSQVLKAEHMYALKRTLSNNYKIIDLNRTSILPIEKADKRPEEFYLNPNVVYYNIGNSYWGRYYPSQIQCLQGPKQLRNIYVYLYSQNKDKGAYYINVLTYSGGINKYKCHYITDVLSYYTVPALKYSDDLQSENE